MRIERGMLTVGFLFHFFKTQNSTPNHVQGLGLIHVRHVSELFETYSNTVENFKDQFFYISSSMKNLM